MRSSRLISWCLLAALLAACSATSTVPAPAVLPSATAATAANRAFTATVPPAALSATSTGEPTSQPTANLSTPATPANGAKTYTVAVGDTIWSIAQRFGVPVQRLIDANPNIDPNLLHAGDVLNIPGPTDVLPTPANASARVRIDGGGLRLRATPTLSGEVLAYLDALTQLRVVGRTADSTWLRVVTPSGETGWVTTAWTDVYVALSQVPIVTADAAPAATTNTVPTAAPSPGPADATTAPPAVNPNGYNYVSGITGHARQVYAQGQQMGNRPNVFSKVGDSITVSDVFLKPIGFGQYNLHDYSGLQGVIDYFTAQKVGGGNNSFDNPSLAAKVGWRASAVLTAGSADAVACQANETPLACEYRLVRPSLALIMLGTNDVISTPDNQYETDMRHVIEFTLSKGIVPVLSTIPPLFRAGYDGRAEQLNVIIIKLAREYDIPLWDYWSALQGLPNSGIGSDGVHPNWAPIGHPADFTPPYLQYGMVVRNLTALYVLDALWRQVLQP